MDREKKPLLTFKNVKSYNPSDKILTRGKKMSLDVSYESNDLHRSKEIQILSCEQICGKHIRLDFEGMGLKEKINEIAQKYPDKCKILNDENAIHIFTGKSREITKNSMGSSKWCFILGVKSSTKKITLLCLRNMLWGIEMSSGLRMKKSTEKYGNEKISEFLLKKVNSIFENPEKWQEIQIYL